LDRANQRRLDAGLAKSADRNGFLQRISSLPKDVPTEILWFHSEFDSTDAALTPAEWTSGVEFDAQQVRSILGQNAAYLFVDPIPYGPGNNAGHQAIKIGMERLSRAGSTLESRRNSTTWT
jgi:hypothetical protein